MARLTRDSFLRAGLEILGDDGSDGLTIAAMCDRLRITKGSFYHHFSGMPDFHEAVLGYWESEHNDRLIIGSEAEPDAMWAVPRLTEIAIGLPHATEAAIRAWGKSNPVVAACQARVDTSRAARILQVLLELGIDDRNARMLTDIGVAVLVGFQHQPPHDIERLRSMLEEVNRLIYLEVSSRE